MNWSRCHICQKTNLQCRISCCHQLFKLSIWLRPIYLHTLNIPCTKIKIQFWRGRGGPYLLGRSDALLSILPIFKTVTKTLWIRPQYLHTTIRIMRTARVCRDLVLWPFTAIQCAGSKLRCDVDAVWPARLPSLLLINLRVQRPTVSLCFFFFFFCDNSLNSGYLMWAFSLPAVSWS